MKIKLVAVYKDGSQQHRYVDSDVEHLRLDDKLVIDGNRPRLIQLFTFGTWSSDKERLRYKKEFIDVMNSTSLRLGKTMLNGEVFNGIIE